jgi:hypothetical protein
MGLLYPLPACWSRGSASLIELKQDNLRIDTLQEKLDSIVVASMEDMYSIRKEEAFEILLALMKVQTLSLLSVIYTSFAIFLKAINIRCSLSFSCIRHSPFNLINVVAL